MFIHLKHSGQPVVNFSVQGTVIDVSGVTIDTAERQEDIPTTIEIRNNGGQVGEGGDGAYLAQIYIPDRQYVESESYDESGNMQLLRSQIPLDHNSVKVTLWPSI